jgi:SAM-dependent methyltransferase
VPADPGFLFARASAGVQCDEDRLPFADGSFDLVLSVGLFDSVNDLPGALTLIRRVLRPDGLLLAAFVGAGSLPRLRAAMLAADEAQGGAAPRIHPQIDVRAAGDLLTRAGFALPVADVEPVHIRYSGLARLLSDLRGMAGTNVLRAQHRAPLSRLGYAAALADFDSAADPDGKTVEKFDILHLSGWAPSPDQPKAARRGSATASLADALRPKPPG